MDNNNVDKGILIERLVDLLKEQKAGEWTQFTAYTTMKHFDILLPYAATVVKELANHPEVESRVSKQSSAKNRKPLEYRIKAAEKEEDKKAAKPKMHKNYKHLTEVQFNELNKELPATKKENKIVFDVANALMGLGENAHNHIKAVADLLLISETDAKKHLLTAVDIIGYDDPFEELENALLDDIPDAQAAIELLLGRAESPVCPLMEKDEAKILEATVLEKEKPVEYPHLTEREIASLEKSYPKDKMVLAFTDAFMGLDAVDFDPKRDIPKLLPISQSDVAKYLDMISRVSIFDVEDPAKGRTVQPRGQEVITLVETPVAIEKPEAMEETVKKEELLSMLLGNMESFKAFWEATTGELVKYQGGEDLAKYEILKEANQKLIEENEKLKKQNDEGTTCLEKIVTESTRMNKAFELQNVELKDAKKRIKALRTMNDNVIDFTQERFQLALAEATNEVSRFTQIPQYQMTPTERAKFQNNLLSTISSAIDEILSHNKAIVTEE